MNFQNNKDSGVAAGNNNFADLVVANGNGGVQVVDTQVDFIRGMYSFAGSGSHQSPPHSPNALSQIGAVQASGVFSGNSGGNQGLQEPRFYQEV